jgi:hypothetical protein
VLYFVDWHYPALDRHAFRFTHVSPVPLVAATAPVGILWRYLQITTLPSYMKLP